MLYYHIIHILIIYKHPLYPYAILPYYPYTNHTHSIMGNQSIDYPWIIHIDMGYINYYY